MELQDYLVIVRAYWRALIAFVVAGALLALAWSYTQPKVYAANAAGFVTSGTKSADASMANLNDVISKSRAKSYAALATDRKTAGYAAEILGLQGDPAGLIGNIEASQQTDTVLINITAKGATPEDARNLADAWVEALARRVQDVENPDGGGKAAMRLLISEQAQLPGAPISPRIRMNTLLGAVLGGLLGLGYAVARHRLDRRLRTASQIEKDTEVPVVAAVPLLSKGEGAAPADLVVHPDTTTQRLAAEAFRKLRTNLAFMDVDHPPRVIVVTSPSQGDGKSTVAASLAMAVARSGQPVHLIEGDLRRPRVAKTLGLENVVGISDVLAGRVPLTDALHRSAVDERLTVLTSGTRVPNPSEILGSNAMRELLAKLGETGMVIVDAPPLLPVTDGAILARAADGALVVISTGKTLDTELTAALGNLNKVHGKVLGVIMNRVSKRSTTPGTYQEYGYENYTSDADTEVRSRSSKKSGRRAAR